MGLSFALSATAGPLDDIEAASQAEAERQKKEDKNMLIRGEMTIEYAQRYVSEKGGMNGPYGQQIYAYIYAERGGEIKWTPVLLQIFRNQQLVCQNAGAMLRQVNDENEQILAGYSGVSTGYRTVVDSNSKKRAAYEDLKNGVCVGVTQAVGFADAFEKSGASSGSDIFSK